MLNIFIVPHIETAHISLHYHRHFPRLFVASLQLTEGRKGTTWEPSEQ